MKFFIFNYLRWCNLLFNVDPSSFTSVCLFYSHYTRFKKRLNFVIERSILGQNFIRYFCLFSQINLKTIKKIVLTIWNFSWITIYNEYGIFGVHAFCFICVLSSSDYVEFIVWFFEFYQKNLDYILLQQRFFDYTVYLTYNLT